MKSSKSDLVREVSMELDLDDTLVEEVLNAILIEIVDNLCEGRNVTLPTFGTFILSSHPNNLPSKSCKVFPKVKFKPSKSLRKILPKGDLPS